MSPEVPATIKIQGLVSKDADESPPGDRISLLSGCEIKHWVLFPKK